MPGLEHCTWDGEQTDSDSDSAERAYELSIIISNERYLIFVLTPNLYSLPLSRMADNASTPPSTDNHSASDVQPLRSIVVLGAGVIGLSIAHTLSEDKSNKITIVARDMPEHLDSQGWSSPWAVCNSFFLLVYPRAVEFRFT